MSTAWPWAHKYWGRSVGFRGPRLRVQGATPPLYTTKGLEVGAGGGGGHGRPTLVLKKKGIGHGLCGTCQSVCALLLNKGATGHLNADDHR